MASGSLQGSSGGTQLLEFPNVRLEIKAIPDKKRNAVASKQQAWQQPALPFSQWLLCWVPLVSQNSLRMYHLFWWETILLAVPVVLKMYSRLALSRKRHTNMKMIAMKKIFSLYLWSPRNRWQVSPWRVTGEMGKEWAEQGKREVQSVIGKFE